MSCPDCFRGSVHTHAEATGVIETIHGLRCYVAGGSDSSRSKSTIIYLPDIFSLKLVNNKILADKYASGTGARVLIPDVVYNGGIDPSIMPQMEALMEIHEHWSFAGVWSKFIAALQVVPAALPYIIYGRPWKVYDTPILKFARDVRADLPEGGKLGVAGFCWGAWPSTKLCVETAVAGDESSGRLIDAQFNGHPSFIINTPEMVVDAITKYKVPYMCAVAEHDFQFNPAAAEKTEALIREKAGPSGQGAAGDAGYVYEFKLHKGCKHGFCVRAQEDPSNIQGYNDALKDAIDWFNKYLN